VKLASRTRAFDGRWGDIYDGLVYHHGSGSFRFSPRHRSQVISHARFFERQVVDRELYRLTPLTAAELKIRSAGSRFLAVLGTGRSGR
jgi:hypothetical protein